jgi:hypothetical protein
MKLSSGPLSANTAESTSAKRQSVALIVRAGRMGGRISEGRLADKIINKQRVIHIFVRLCELMMDVRERRNEGFIWDD